MHRSWLGAIIVAITCVGGTASAARADATAEKAVRDLIATIDASADWNSTVRAIRSEGSAVVVEGWTIAAQDGTFNFGLEKGRLEGLSESTNGTVSLDHLSVGGQKLTMSQFSAEIPDCVADRLMLTAATLPRFDRTKPAATLVSFYRFFAHQGIGRLSCQEATAEWKGPGDGSSGSRSVATYKGIVIEGLDRGVIARQRTDKISVETRDGAPGANNQVNSAVDYQDVESLNVNLNAFLRVADPEEYRDGPGDGIWMIFADRSRIGKVSARSAGKEVLSLGGVEIQDIKIRQLDKPLATIIDGLIASPPNSNAEELTFLSGDLKSLLNFAAAGKISIFNLSAGHESEGSVGFKAMVLDRLSPDGLDRLAIEGGSVVAPDFKASLVSFDLEGIRWPRIDAFADMMRYDQSRAGNNGKSNPGLAAEAAGSAFYLLPKLGALSLSGMSLSLAGSAPITIDRYDAHLDEFIGNYPVSGSGSLSGLDIPGTLLRTLPDAGPALDALGYTDFNLGLQGKVDHDTATGSYSAVNSLTLQDGGTLFLDYRLGGITEASVKSTLAQIIAADGEPDPNQVMSFASGFTFEGLRLRFEDNSLTRRILALAAKLQNMDEPTLTATAIAMAQLGLIQLKRPQFAEQTVAAVTAYLKAPKSFTLLLRPAQPVPLLQLMQVDPANPGILIDMLGASVTAND